MQLKRKKRQAGDTLVEVLLAFSIFGAAATTITRAMNEGFVQMFSSGQQSQVQGLMRGQLAIVQAAHDNEIKDPSSNIWDLIINEIGDNDTEKQAAVNADGCTYSLNKNRLFFTTANGGTWTQPESVAKVTSTANQAVAVRTVTPSPNGNSMWIEARYTPPGTNNRGYYDFYAKSCWTDGRINRQLKTVLRLYDLVAPASEGSPLAPTAPPAAPPPPPPPPVVAPIQTPGSGYLAGRCTSINPLEGNETTQSPPASGFFTTPSGSYPCRSLAFNANTVYTCTNYDIEYPSSVITPGRYQLTLSYQDAVCDTGAIETLNAGISYYYHLEVYVNGVRNGAMVLSPDTTSGTYLFNSLNPGDRIGFRWWNNRFFPTVPGKDPDFVFTNLRLDYTP